MTVGVRSRQDRRLLPPRSRVIGASIAEGHRALQPTAVGLLPSPLDIEGVFAPEKPTRLSSVLAER